MRARLLTILLCVVLATAGCFGLGDDGNDGNDGNASGDNPDDGGDTGGNTTDPGDDPDDTGNTGGLVVEGPEWSLGDAWTIDVTWNDDRGTSTWEMVTFDADGEHYWLGVPDREQSLDHVVTDTNPLIGRIHYSILSPHEDGRHAGMFDFPIEDGKVWKGFFFGEEWTFKATETQVQGEDGTEPGFVINGTIAGKPEASLVVDYVPSEKWFRNLEIQGAVGGDVTLTVTERTTTTGGPYYFHRGPDVLDETLANSVAGRSEQTFTLEETEHLKFLLAQIEGTSDAASTSLEFVTPDGTTAATVNGDNLSGRVEIEDPQPGEWTVRLTSIGGDATYHVKAWAVDEHTGEV